MSRPTLLAAATLVTTLATLPVAEAKFERDARPASEPTLRERVVGIFKLDVDVDFHLVPRGVTEQLVRWQRAMRDFVHHAVEGIAALADHPDSARIPDLSVLTVEPVANSESSGFGWRNDPIRHRPKFHGGTDFRGKHGTPVLASGPGVVVFAGRRGGYGNLVEIDHGGGVITRYAHLRRIEAKRDTAVLAGQRIGQVGSTGRATGPHLHFEVRLGDRPVDPVTALHVAQLERESPALARIAANALAPELQAHVSSRIDPPKHRRTPKGQRPERRGRAKRVKPVS